MRPAAASVRAVICCGLTCRMPLQVVNFRCRPPTYFMLLLLYNFILFRTQYTWCAFYCKQFFCFIYFYLFFMQFPFTSTTCHKSLLLWAPKKRFIIQLEPLPRTLNYMLQQYMWLPHTLSPTIEASSVAVIFMANSINFIVAFVAVIRPLLLLPPQFANRGSKIDARPYV